MFSVLCIHPTLPDVGVVIANDIDLAREISKLNPADWDKFERQFGYDGCQVQHGDAQYFPVPKRMKMSTLEYIALVLAA